jgi:6-phosphogluconolactonase (cycloisomerase 2 family)
MRIFFVGLISLASCAPFPASLNEASIQTAALLLAQRSTAPSTEAVRARYAYIANNGDNTISMYSIDTSGVLTSLGTIASGGGTPRQIVADPLGRYIYVATAEPPTWVCFSINRTTGGLTFLGTVPTGGTPYAIAVNPAGTFVFTANNAGNSISVFSINHPTAPWACLQPMPPARRRAG